MKLTIEAPSVESAETPSGVKVYLAFPPVVENLPEPVPEPVPAPVLEVYEPKRTRWLAPKESSSTNGKGTQFDPWRVGTSFEYDAVFQRGLEAMSAQPTEFHLYPGQYFTRGVWAYAAQKYMVIGSGEALIGAGSRKTIISLDTDNAVYETDFKARPDSSLLWAGVYYGRGIGMRVEGICLDGQYERLSSDKHIGGVRFFGSHSVCRDVGVIGVQGILSTQMECFPISTINYDGNDGSDPTDGGDLIEDCWVRDVCPNSYVSAISVGQRPLPGKRRIVPSVVQRCHVDLGHSNYFGFSFCHNTIIRDSSCTGVKNALYNDTDSVGDVIVENCDLTTQYNGMCLASTELTAGKSNVKIRRCRFDFQPIGRVDMSLLVLSDSKGAAYSGISVDDCHIVSKQSQRLSLASIVAEKIQNVRITNNVIDTPRCFHHLPMPTPKSCLVLDANYEPDGSLINGFYPLVSGT